MNVTMLSRLPEQSFHFTEESKPAAKIRTGDFRWNFLEGYHYLLAQLANQLLELWEADPINFEDVPRADVDRCLIGVRDFSDGEY